LALAKNCPYSSRITITELGAARIIAHCEAMGWLKRRRHTLGDVLFMDERRAVLASYFRNNILHLFAMPALIAGCLTNRTEISRERVLAMVGQIYPFIRAELFLDRTRPIAPGAEDAVAAMMLVELLDVGSSRTAVSRPASGTTRAAQLRLCAQLVAPFLERYYMAIAMLLAAVPGSTTRASLVDGCRQAAEHLSLIYDLNSPDLFDHRLFRNFIDILEEEALVSIDDEGRLQVQESLEELGASLGTLLSPQVRQTLLQLASAGTGGAATHAHG
jgi:glycerol-3-phosphate O-acyltransferase